MDTRARDIVTPPVKVAASEQELCSLARSDDPMLIQGFASIPLEIATARRQLLDPQTQQLRLVATPSLSLLMCNSVFCCVLAATPASMLADEARFQATVLLSFSTASRLFSTFGGVGSGNYHRLSELHQMPMSFRAYDRKLYVLALAHLIRHFSSSSSDNNNNNNNATKLFATLSEEGYGSDPQQLSTGFFREIISTAVSMLVENAYYDCRMLAALAQASNKDEGNNNNNQRDEFFQDFDSEDGMDSSYGDDDDDDTDATTDDDDDLGFFAEDDDDDDDDDDVGDNDFGEGGADDDHEGGGGGGGKRSQIERLAAEARRYAQEVDDEDDDSPPLDDFHENLLVEDPNDQVETPVDDIDEFRVIGQVFESVLQQQQQPSNNNFVSIVGSALQSLLQEFGGIPVCRMREQQQPAKRKMGKKKQQHQQNAPGGGGEQVFALHNALVGGAPMGTSMPLPDFLRECSTQRARIENFE